MFVPTSNTGRRRSKRVVISLIVAACAVQGTRLDGQGTVPARVPGAHVFRHANRADISVSPNDFFPDPGLSSAGGLIEKRDGVEYFGQEIRDSQDRFVVKILVCKNVVDGVVRIVTDSTVPLELRIYPYGITPEEMFRMDPRVVPKKVKIEAGRREYSCSLKDS